MYPERLSLMIEHYGKIDKSIKDFDTSFDKCFQYIVSSDGRSRLNIIGDIYNCDISSAGPSALRYIYGDSDEINRLFSMDKKSRSIYISTRFKDDLRYINYILKMVIITYVECNFTNIMVLEFTKDGMVFTGDYRIISKEMPFYMSYFSIKTEIFKRYSIFSRTVMTIDENGVIKLRGELKDPPNVIFELIKDLPKAHRIYNSKYLKAMIKYGFFEDIDRYYRFGNGKFLSLNGFTPDPNKIVASRYLVDLIYPIVYY
ncbi:MAG: hypothetical protein QXD03_03085 [Candidatus Anstonellales archaeon]